MGRNTKSGKVVYICHSDTQGVPARSLGERNEEVGGRFLTALVKMPAALHNPKGP